jgi:hypothetical protein
LSEQQFWRLTPAKFAELAECHKEAVQMSFLPMAKLASIYVNCHLKEGAEPTTPADFIPGMVKPERAELPPEILLAQFDSYNQHVGGERLM